MNTNDIVVRQPKFHLVLFITGAVLFLFLFLFIVRILLSDINNSEKQLAIFIFLPLLLLCPFRVILWFRFKIILNGDQIKAAPYFGKTKTFPIGYITTVKLKIKNMDTGEEEHITAYHENEKLFSVQSNCPGCFELLSCLKEKGLNFVAG